MSDEFVQCRMRYIFSVEGGTLNEISKFQIFVIESIFIRDKLFSQKVVIIFRKHFISRKMQLVFFGFQEKYIIVVFV